MIQKSKTSWVRHTVALHEDTMAIYDLVKKSDRFNKPLTDNEMLEYMLAGLLYLNENNVRFSGFSRGLPKEEVFQRLVKYYADVKVTSSNSVLLKSAAVIR